MEADPHRNSSGGSTTPPPVTQVESVTPEELHKEQSKPSRNPLKWFKNSGAASSATDSNSSRSSSKSTSSSNSKAKPPLVVHYFPTAGRPGLT